MKRLALIVIAVALPVCLLAESDRATAYLRMGDISTVKQSGVFNFSTRLEVALSEEMQDALRNGVRQVYLLELQVRVPRFKVFHREVFSRKHRYELRYHALSKKYLVKHINSETQLSFYTLSAALEHLGKIVELPLLTESALDDFTDYDLRVKFMLDIEELPLPLKIHALMNRDWRIATNWQEWVL